MRTIRICNITLLTLLLFSLSSCTALFFQPQSQHVLTPERLGLEYEDIYFNSIDGLTLHGWYLPAPASARGTVLFLHGNGENISTHIAGIYWLPSRGYNVFIFDYRGYGRSEGIPDVEGALADVESALQTLVARTDIDSDRIVVLGQSLGGALAISAVAQSPLRNHVRAVISDSAFSSYRTIIREKMSDFFLTWPFQWVPWLTMDDKYSPVDTTPMLSPIPLLILHSEQDPIIPVHHATRLYESAREPKELWILPAGAHIEALTHKANQEKLVNYLERIMPAPP